MGRFEQIRLAPAIDLVEVENTKLCLGDGLGMCLTLKPEWCAAHDEIADLGPFDVQEYFAVHTHVDIEYAF